MSKVIKMKQSYQTTISDSVTLSGVGVHSGQPVRLVLHPADPDQGIVFLRTGLPHGRERLIDARYNGVCATELCTVLGQANNSHSKDATVSTIEHLMAALSGLGVDNLLIEIDGSEVPILDGSSAPFIDAIDQVGLSISHTVRRYIRILQPVRISDDRGYAELIPADRGFRLDVEIDFKSPLIGRQRKILDLTPTSFRQEISRARTFGFMSDVERLWKAGFALGASLDNTVALGESGIVNPEGLRYADEFVRHKMLDAVGDLSLSGLPMIGEYRSYCGGHRLNVAVLEALFSSRANYAIIDAAPRRDSGIAAELVSGISQPVFAPEI
jgi:UDP-3-O-[3-hydroxymyristoyl] N-acetylglucosamine deacetylase